MNGLVGVLGGWIPLKRACSIAVAVGVGSSRLLAGVNSWTTTGPPGGALSVAVDPGNPSIFYSVNYQQAWRSTDRGGSWQFAFLEWSRNPQYVLLSVTAGPSYTVYVGTGGFQANLLKSPNGGLGWTQASMLRSICSVKQILVNPIVPATVYVLITNCRGCANCTPGGEILRSLDAGRISSRSNKG